MLDGLKYARDVAQSATNTRCSGLAPDNWAPAKSTISHRPFHFSLCEPEKLLGAGDVIDDDVLPADDDRGCGIGLPDHRRNQIGGGHHRVAGGGETNVSGRPGQNHVGSVSGDGQWRRQRGNNNLAIVWVVRAGGGSNIGENRYCR